MIILVKWLFLSPSELCLPAELLSWDQHAATPTFESNFAGILKSGLAMTDCFQSVSEVNTLRVGFPIDQSHQNIPMPMQYSHAQPNKPVNLCTASTFLIVVKGAEERKKFYVPMPFA